MDFPQAWKFTRSTRLEDHDPKCSWAKAGLLCDCRVLWDEIERRESMFKDHMTDEEFVRGAWNLSRDAFGIYLGGTSTSALFYASADGWSVARKFTEERLEVVGKAAMVLPFYVDRCERILARLESILAEKKRGMKEANQ